MGTLVASSPAMRGAPLTLVATLWVMSFDLACGGDEFTSGPPPPCNTDPWSCTDGQTCWVNSDGDGFACLNPGPGASGAACSLVAGSVGCDTGLWCLGDACRPFCDNEDAAHACPDGMGCRVVTIVDTAQQPIGDVQVCRPP
jgi:hypothetical protein